MRIGDLDVQAVLDGHGHEPAGTMLEAPTFAGDPWACHSDLLDRDGNIEMTLGGFLIRTGGRVMVVDTGVGTIDNDHYHGGQFLQSLRDIDVEPGDVTDVVFTHLHFDHVGWATQRGEVVFPNAVYRVHSADWSHFVDGPTALPGAVRKLAPLRERLEPFHGEITLAPGFDARPAPGHTPGTTMFVLSGPGERALLLGDVAHSIVELLEDHWEAVYDLDRAAGRAVRAAVAGELLDTEMQAAGGHFPRLQFGRLVTSGSARQWVVA
jgi:glyoxylase-like metal-dependent hydrolase (beta-lactamase superfamily II)